jgi:hypothetical protein
LISRYSTWKLRQNAPRNQRASGLCRFCAAWSAAVKARLSSGGNAHSPISTYELVGTYTRPIGGWSANQAEGVTVLSQEAFVSRAVKNRSTQRPAPQQCSQVVGQAPNFSPSSPIIPIRSPASVAWSRR